MKREFTQLLGAVSIIFIVLMSLGTYTGLHQQSPRTYNGEQSFTNMEDALSFLNDVAREAKRQDAEIQKLDLTKQSPPTVSFTILAKAEKVSLLGDTSIPFKYGEAYESVSSANHHIVVAYILMPLMGIGALYCIFSKRVADYFERQS